MTETLSHRDAARFAAAWQAVGMVSDGMKLGLGTGATATWMVRCLAERVARDGIDVTCVPTSTRTGDLARAYGLRVAGLDDVGRLDLTIDGTDEVDPDLRLIKGGGGAHLQEKIVAAASDRLVIVIDGAKAVDRLGAFPLPVEVTPFGHGLTALAVEQVLAGADVNTRTVTLRMDGDAPFVTDEGNHTLDLDLGRIDDPRALHDALLRIPGVIETGLFLDMAETIAIGAGDGTVTLRRVGRTDETAHVDLNKVADLPPLPS